MDIVRIICAGLPPPLGVFLQVGCRLTPVGYIFGIIHAVRVVARR